MLKKIFVINLLIVTSILAPVVARSADQPRYCSKLMVLKADVPLIFNLKSSDGEIFDLGSPYALIKSLVSDVADMEIYNWQSPNGGEIQILTFFVHDHADINQVQKKLEYIQEQTGLGSWQKSEANGVTFFDTTKMLCKAGACLLVTTLGSVIGDIGLTALANVPHWWVSAPSSTAVLIPRATLALSLAGLVALPFYSIKRYMRYFKNQNSAMDKAKIASQLKSDIGELQKNIKPNEFDTVIFITRASYDDTPDGAPIGNLEIRGAMNTLKMKREQIVASPDGVGTW